MEQKSQPKWEGKVSVKLTSTNADQIWALFKDFFNMHKWFPSLTTCHGIHGTNGELGCLRYCAGFSISSKGTNAENNFVRWSKERLIAIDHVERSLSYEIVDSNIGFESYTATFKINSLNDNGQDGCVIDWLFTVDPIQGWKLDDFTKKYEMGIQGMAKKMEDALVGEKVAV